MTAKERLWRRLPRLSPRGRVGLAEILRRRRRLGRRSPSAPKKKVSTKSFSIGADTFTTGVFAAWLKPRAKQASSFERLILDFKTIEGCRWFRNPGSVLGRYGKN